MTVSVLAPPESVARRISEAYVRAPRHDGACPDYPPDFRPLIRVEFKVAAEMGPRYLG